MINNMLTSRQQCFLNKIFDNAHQYKQIGQATYRIDLGFKIDLKFLLNEGIYIESIDVPKKLRRKGVGHFAMSEITSFADCFNQGLSLDVVPYSNSTISKTDLIEFYEKHGFKLGRDTCMWRPLV